VRNFAPAVPVLFLCSLGFAQIPVVPRTTTQANPQSQAAALNKSNVLSAAVHSPLTSTDCSFNFNSGADNTFLHFCVTANGNVVEFETPAGHRLATVSRSEGYGICDILGGVDYHDYANAGDNGTFGPATVLSQSATSVKIVRTTTDGSITFTQTITQLPGTSPSAKIVMTLKNNTAVDKAINLTRFMDVDADTTSLTISMPRATLPKGGTRSSSTAPSDSCCKMSAQRSSLIADSCRTPSSDQTHATPLPTSPPDHHRKRRSRGHALRNRPPQAQIGNRNRGLQGFLEETW